MSYMEFNLNTKYNEAVRWLESSGHIIDGTGYPEALMRAAKGICNSCPLKTMCRPRYGYTKFLFEKSSIVVSGADITSNSCTLYNKGVSLKELRREL